MLIAGMHTPCGNRVSLVWNFSWGQFSYSRRWSIAIRDQALTGEFKKCRGVIPPSMLASRGLQPVDMLSRALRLDFTPGDSDQTDQGSAEQPQGRGNGYR